MSLGSRLRARSSSGLADRVFPRDVPVGARRGLNWLSLSVRQMRRYNRRESLFPQEGSTMLIDRYAPVDIFAPVPELAGQTDPELKALDILLEDDQLFGRVKADLARRFPHTADRGRHSTPVEAILRLLLVKHLHNWSFQETQERVADSLILRWFCRVYFRRVPDDTTLIRWSQLIRPETLEALNERVVQLAVQQRELYQRLVETTEEMVQQAERVSVALRRRKEQGAQHLRDQVGQILPLVRRVITQTRTRVLEGKKVAAEEIVLCLFEPHTRVIPRHKGGADG